MALTDDLRAYYKLDESSGNATDSSGNGYTLTNTNTVGYAPAKINNGADLGTANTNKRLLNSSRLGLSSGSSLTISGWVKANSAPGSGVDYTIFDLRDGTAATDTEAWLKYVNIGGTRKLRWLYPLQEAGSFVTYDIDLGTSTYYFVVGTYDGTSIRMYVNGTQQGGTVTATSGGSSLSDAFCIGATGNGFVFGSLTVDEVGVWSRALSDSEITELYNGGAGLTYPFTGGGVNTTNFFYMM